MPDAGVAGEKLVIFSRRDEHNFGAGVSPFGGVQEHTGNGDIGPERYARQHVDHAACAGWPSPSRPLPDTSLQFGADLADHCSEQLFIHLAQPRLEQIPKPLHDDRKERAAFLLRQSAIQELAGPCFAPEATIEKLATGTFQPAAPASCAWPRGSPSGR